MTITRADLDSIYEHWFRNSPAAEQAKLEILALFSGEPDEAHCWTEQDIYEQARKIIASFEHGR